MVTGGARGVGEAIASQIAASGYVVVLDVQDATGRSHPRVRHVPGDAADGAAAEHAAHIAESLAPLAGWVNNAAVFRDANFETATASEILQLVTANLAPALVGCHAAVNHFLRTGRAGAVVNISSHQAQRPVRGALPYATAKGAIETLTKAVAVDYGPAGIRTNAIALGSISTPRLTLYQTTHPGLDAQLAALHPLGRAGRAEEVADLVTYLLSERSSFLNGAIIPLDGGRAAQGADPEAT